MSAPGDRNRSLAEAIVAFIDPRTPSRIFSLLREEGRGGLSRRLDAMSPGARDDVYAKADAMASKDIYPIFWGDEGYPDQLGELASSSPILFCWGDRNIFQLPGIGMCGARNVTDLGLKAASLCAEEAQASGLTVVSGYAKGVDTETHLAALRNGGKTIIVLPEGFDHFRIKRDFPRELFRAENVLVISQFAPRQPWSASGAMTRNRLIYGLGLALVVIEAGEKGGTLAAGEGAIQHGRPVLVLDFDSSTPTGNRILVERGGVPVPNRARLHEAMAKLKKVSGPRNFPLQLDLIQAAIP